MRRVLKDIGFLFTGAIIGYAMINVVIFYALSPGEARATDRCFDYPLEFDQRNFKIATGQDEFYTHNPVTLYFGQGSDPTYKVVVPAERVSGRKLNMCRSDMIKAGMPDTSYHSVLVSWVDKRGRTHQMYTLLTRPLQFLSETKTSIKLFNLKPYSQAGM